MVVIRIIVEVWKVKISNFLVENRFGWEQKRSITEIWPHCELTFIQETNRYTGRPIIKTFITFSNLSNSYAYKAQPTFYSLKCNKAQPTFYSLKCNKAHAVAYFSVRNAIKAICCIFYICNAMKRKHGLLCLKRSASCATTKNDTFKRFASLRFKLRNAHLRLNL